MTNTMADYNLWLVLLSFGVSVLGSLTGLFVASLVPRDGTIRLRWLVLAALLIGGCGIWAMHFVGMIAFDPGGAMTYDTVMTFVSLAIPILFLYFGLYCVFRWRNSWVALITAGVITGLAVASMHYTGMAAMRIAANQTYDPVVVAVSVAIAIVAATAALYIVVYVGGIRRHLSSVAMALAVCGMHYTGMAALSLQPANIDVDYFSGALTPQVMLVAVTAVVVAACTIGGLMAWARLVEDVRSDAAAEAGGG